jgi:hypothetical protein
MTHDSQSGWFNNFKGGQEQGSCQQEGGRRVIYPKQQHLYSVFQARSIFTTHLTSTRITTPDEMELDPPWNPKTSRIVGHLSSQVRAFYLKMSATLFSIWMENIAWTMAHRVTPGSECGGSSFYVSQFFMSETPQRPIWNNLLDPQEGDEGHKEGYFTLLTFLFLEIAKPFIIQSPIDIHQKINHRTVSK